MPATALSPRAVSLIASDKTCVDPAVARWLARVASEVLPDEAPPVRTFPNHSAALAFARETICRVVWVLTATDRERREVSQTLHEVSLLNAEENYLRVRALVLMADPHDPSTAIDYRTLGASVGRLDLDGAEGALKDSLWMAANQDKDLATLQILYPDPERIRIRLIGPLDSVDLPIDDTITKLVEYLACNPGWHSKKALAAELGVSIETPTVYIDRFRKSFDQVRRKAGEAKTGKHVLVSAKLGVGWGYRLVACLLK